MPIMPHKPLVSKIFRTMYASAAVALAVACESTPKAGSAPDPSRASPDAKAPAQAPAAGPKRIQATRAGASQPAAAATPQDPSLALMNPGDEVDGNVGAERLAARRPSSPKASKPAPAAATPGASPAPGPAAQAVPATPSAPPAGPAAPGLRAPTDAERAAAARMSRESAARRDAAAKARARAIADSESAADTAVWGVFLASFTGEDHREAAQASRDAIARRFPDLADAFVVTNSRGSMVLVGRFNGPEDPSAQARLKFVKELQEGGQRVFTRSMLTRTATDADQGPPGPFDLRSVRQRLPKPTLYSVQVAAWSCLGSEEVKYADMRRAAESYCRELRAKGEEAFYFHDSYSRTSTVLVGVFGTDAYDPRSTLYSPEVDAVFKRHPKHLVNGDEVLQPADPAKPNGKTIPQAPRLVEIPRM